MIDLKAIREVASVTSDNERMQFKPPSIIALCDEIERLTACLNKANDQAEHFEREWYLRGDRLEAAETEVLEQARLLGIGGEKELALMAKLEAAEKDAARYRYLRESNCVTGKGVGSSVKSGWFVNLSYESLDAAIDAAMKEQK